MKLYYTLFFSLFSLFLSYSQNVSFADDTFRYVLVNNDCVDTDNDGIYDSDADTNDDEIIQVSEAEAVLHLSLTGGNIDSLIGIEAFSNLQTLRLIGHNDITELDLTPLSNLTSLYARDNGFDTVNLAGLINLESLIISYGVGQLTNLDLSNLNSLQEVVLNNGDLTSLNVSGLTNLEILGCFENSLSSLDISDLINLQELNIGYNPISSIDLSTLTNLRELKCYFAELDSLDLNGLTNLEIVHCFDNPLNELVVNGLPNLTEIDSRNTLLNTIDLTELPNLVELNVSNCQLNLIDTSLLPSLQYLYLEDNELEIIDVSSSTDLGYFNIANNQLTTMLLKNGSELSSLNFSNNPNIEYICIDDFESESIYAKLDQYGYTNCVVNSYCSFIPGGEFYTIEGQNNIDVDFNGCDPSDPVYPNLKYSITNGVLTDEVVSNLSGEFFLPVQEGIHMLTPNFENPDYFISSPTSITVDFPSDSSPSNHEFCITANGTYNDLEILIIPMETPRPGFDTNYKIIYKNKGSTSLSGHIDFNYSENAELMEFVAASPFPDNFIDSVLTWNYSDLVPFESREISVTLNMNSPMETPPLNGGENINFTADIFPMVADETASDNTIDLKQTVVNSFDPNDKTCLEGETISPEQVGEYLHYLIRFENSGTANAVNIVVKDVIDTNRLDITTLVPLHSSHNYITRINDNIVEFIFENIQLPFDDANNDGYIAFKIKSIDTLQLGETIDNNAEIYFDFNFPIITNISQVTVATLSITENTIHNNKISIYPNPVKNILRIGATNVITSISIFNPLGQKILITNPNTFTEEIDINNLNQGIYLVNVQIGDHTSTHKIIKQ